MRKQFLGDVNLMSSLKIKAKEIRQETFEMVLSVGKGHLGGSLSIVEVLVALYYTGIFRFRAKNPRSARITYRELLA